MHKAGDIWIEYQDGDVVDIGMLTTEHPESQNSDCEMEGAWYARWARSGKNLYFFPDKDSNYKRVNDDLKCVFTI